MFSFLHAAILGCIEGVTEFLPISSTAHLVIGATILKLQQTDFVKTFEVVIQSGAILAVVVLYWKRLFLNAEIFKKVAVAFLPTAILGLLLYKIIKKYFEGNLTLVIWSLAIGGIALIVFELMHKENTSAVAEMQNITYTQAALIGVFQSVAFIPGVSRSAATIVGGLLLGLKRAVIVEFTFLLAIPTMLAATGLDLLKSAHSITMSGAGLLAVGFGCAFVTALLGIKWFLGYIKNHTFVWFGAYRIVIAALCALFLV